MKVFIDVAQITAGISPVLAERHGAKLHYLAGEFGVRITNGGHDAEGVDWVQADIRRSNPSALMDWLRSLFTIAVDLDQADIVVLCGRSPETLELVERFLSDGVTAQRLMRIPPEEIMPTLHGLLGEMQTTPRVGMEEMTENEAVGILETFGYKVPDGLPEPTEEKWEDPVVTERVRRHLEGEPFSPWSPFDTPEGE